MSQLKIKNGNSWESIPAGGIGVPSGGTAGQVLTKSSSTDYATEWKTIPKCYIFGMSTATYNTNSTITLTDISAPDSDIYRDGDNIKFRTAKTVIAFMTVQGKIPSGTSRYWISGYDGSISAANRVITILNNGSAESYFANTVGRPINVTTSTVLLFSPGEKVELNSGFSGDVSTITFVTF